MAKAATTKATSTNRPLARSQGTSGGVHSPGSKAFWVSRRRSRDMPPGYAGVPGASSAPGWSRPRRGLHPRVEAQVRLAAPMTDGRPSRSMMGMLTNTLDAAIAVRSPAAEPAVSVRGLRKAYGDREVVRGIDFEIHRGEVVAVLGPNGAGKTTTVEILEGFRRADARRGPRARRRPRHAPAATGASAWASSCRSPRPEQGLTVRDCLRRYAGYYRTPRDVDETLERVGLADRADVRAQALSGGQQRRLDVALALIGDPELLFLDEPTTGFDPSARRAAWELVDSLRAGGTTILLTTHYMEEAERLADRIVVLRDGEVVGSGTPRTLGGRDRAQSEIVFALPGGLAPGDLPVELAARARMAPGGRFSVPSPDAAADLYALAGWAVAQGVPLAELEVRRPTLEDVYLELTR